MLNEIKGDVMARYGLEVTSVNFISIGVPEKTAREDACKIEHDLSEASYAAICTQIK